MKNDLGSMGDPPLISARDAWKPRRWAVLGASGFIGKNISRRLREAGFEVRELSGPRVNFTVGPHPIEGIIRASDGHSAVDYLADQLRGIEVVVNAAGIADPGGFGGDSIYGANSLLPVVIAEAAEKAGVQRLIHLSSAAVQGRRAALDASTDVAPFSHYSYSKALGERGLLAFLDTKSEMDISIIRATSVQGPDRRTTEKLQRIAKTPLSSVASPGDQPSVVSSVTALCEFIQVVGEYTKEMSMIQLQPWEKLSVKDVMILAGDRDPIILPYAMCRFLVASGHFIGRAVPIFAGITRRVEMMWFGQKQDVTKNQVHYDPDPSYIRLILTERQAH